MLAQEGKSQSRYSNHSPDRRRLAVTKCHIIFWWCVLLRYIFVLYECSPVRQLASNNSLTQPPFTFIVQGYSIFQKYEIFSNKHSSYSSTQVPRSRPVQCAHVYWVSWHKFTSLWLGNYNFLTYISRKSRSLMEGLEAHCQHLGLAFPLISSVICLTPLIGCSHCWCFVVVGKYSLFLHSFQVGL